MNTLKMKGRRQLNCIIVHDEGPSEKRRASLERTVRKIIISHCNYNTFLDLREEDNLFIVDEMVGPKVSFIWRLLDHCIPIN